MRPNVRISDRKRWRARPGQQVAQSALTVVLLVSTALATADSPRTSDGRPDLSGTYDVATLTPLQRNRIFGNKLMLTREQADRIAARAASRREAADQQSDPDRGAPPEGGDGSGGAAGNVGGYNNFWVDNGVDMVAVDGKFRTSIIVEPRNGRLPKMTPAAAKKWRERRSQFRANSGEAWWLDQPGGPYDDPEIRPLAERCLLGFGSTSGPPMLPVLYNNLKTIVQTPDHVVILVEMNHDARIVRIGGKHPPPDVRKWMGDSIGWWEGDTLVVDTTNFRDITGLNSGTATLHVVERFSRVDEETLHYSFTVTDPNVWETPWRGEYSWPTTDDRMFEYACHEGNYGLTNILRGARVLEAAAQEHQ